MNTAGVSIPKKSDSKGHLCGVLVATSLDPEHANKGQKGPKNGPNGSKVAALSASEQYEATSELVCFPSTSC